MIADGQDGYLSDSDSHDDGGDKCNEIEEKSYAPQRQIEICDEDRIHWPQAYSCRSPKKEEKSDEEDVQLTKVTELSEDSSPEHIKESDLNIEQPRNGSLYMHS